MSNQTAISHAGVGAARTAVRRLWTVDCGPWTLLAALFLSTVVAACAADKSGVSPTTISLPKGPGSVEGLGESFQPSLNTGTAKYSVPLALPPGTAGHAPALSLEYEGGVGNGPLGFGWELPLDSVQRRSDRGIPTYGEFGEFDRQDAFINEAREELVPRGDGFYFCKNEAAFIRYQAVSNHWEATQPDGTRLEFGVTPQGRIEDADAGHAFSWLLQRETDTHGNMIVYSYQAFPGTQNINQKYLTGIAYGPGAPPWDNFHFVTFIYEDRPDWSEDCRSGFIVRTGKRLKTIVVGTQGPTLGGHLQGDFNNDGRPDNLVRKYELQYLDYAGTNSHWSLLRRVTMVGADGVTALPPASFGYLVCNPPDQLSAAGQIIGGLHEPPYVMDNSLVDLADLNGDGLPDVLKTGGGLHLAYLNRGETNQSGERVISWAPPIQVAAGSGDAWNFDLSVTNTHLADMDGDGLADLVHKAAAGNVFYFANEGSVGWGERQLMSVITAPPVPFQDPAVRTADVDFDKRTDLIRADGVEYQIWFNQGSNQYSAEVTVLQTNGFDFRLSTVQVADLNGDRIPDIARIWPNGVEVTAGLGYGRFAEMQFMRLPDLTLDAGQVQKAKLADVTGDGLADLVLERAVPGELWFWMNLGNHTFSTRKVIAGMPATIGTKAAIRWADLNGNGTTDLVYCDSAATPRLRTVDIGELLGCVPAPNTLVAISNGIGRVTLIEYQPSTKYALEDAVTGQPWPDVMPFPVSVVASMTTLDSLGHSYVTRFRYHDGYYDPVEKQFRGFARTEQVDVGDPSAPTLVTRSQFDTGRTFEAMKGKLLRVSAEQEDGGVFTDDTTKWVNPPVTLMTGSNGVLVKYVHPVASVKLIKELGQGVERRLESEFAYDSYGNETTNANYGIVADGDRSAFNDQRITTSSYALNTNTWILRLPARREIMDENGLVISRSESFYDDETFSGNNLGQVTIGNLTLKKEWVDPANPASFVQSSRAKYDVYGNTTAILDPLANAPGGALELTKGHVRSLDYDNRLHAFPVTETICVGGGKEALTFHAAYDEGFGTVVTSTDFNTNTTTYGYDPFARLIYIIRPDDAPSYPSTECDYGLAVPFGESGIVNYVETRHLDRTAGTASNKPAHYFYTRQFTDGLGRDLMTRTEAESAFPDGAPRVVVSGAVLFNAREAPARALNPFFTTVTSGTLGNLLSFESVEAPGWTGSFEENGSLVSLDLPNAHQTSTRYDATLRPIEIENADHSLIRTSFEPLLTRTYDENDADPASEFFDTPTVHYEDGLDRLVQVDEITRLNDDGTPAGALKTWTTRYEYDLNDQLTRLTDSQNNVRTFAYDGLKRKTFLNDPDRGAMHFLYDDGSNVIERTDAKGQRITYTYDGANRILTEDLHDEGSTEFSYGRSPDVIYQYDESVPGLDLGDATTATAANTKGKLAWVEDASGEQHTSYDVCDRVSWSVKRIPDPQLLSFSTSHVSLVSYKTAFKYDPMDRLARIVYPDNDEVRYEYTDRSLPTRITGGPAGSILTNLLYWPSGSPSRIDYGNGVRTTYGHDARLRLTQLGTRRSTLGTELVHFVYEFDAASNIKSIEDRRPGSAVPQGDPRRNTQLFRYDDLYRLTRVQYSFNLPGAALRNDGEINYRFDRIGNMLTQTSTLEQNENGLPVANLGQMESGGAAGSWNRTGRGASDPPGPHALTAIRHSPLPTRNYLYDANGNMTVLDGLTNTWDFKDRLVAVESTEMRAEYTYDYTDRRIIKRVWSKPASSPPPNSARQPLTTVYVNKWFETREHDTPVKYVWNGNTRVARVTGSLNTNARLQRLRVWPGWNLCSLAVTAANALDQLGGTGPDSPISDAFKWNPGTFGWDAVSPAETLPAGRVLWLNAATNAALSVSGTYSEPANSSVPASGSFLASAGLALWDLSSAISNEPSLAIWRFDARLSRWGSSLPPPLRAQSVQVPSVAPGEAVFVRAEFPVELAVPVRALNVRYYYDDHLSSAAAVAGQDGEVVVETAYYPFGEPRNERRTANIGESYAFTQKEKDLETGLLYLEARSLAASIGRFIRVEPLVFDMPADWLSAPQHLNSYAYALNNPLRIVDPTGLQPEGEKPTLKRLGATVTVEKAAVARVTARNAANATAQKTVTAKASPDRGAGGNWKKLRQVMSAVGELAELKGYARGQREAKAGVHTALIVGETTPRLKAAQATLKWMGLEDAAVFEPEYGSAKVQHFGYREDKGYIRGYLAAGGRVIDADIDPARAERSRFYGMEQKLMDDVGRKNVITLEEAFGPQLTPAVRKLIRINDKH